MKQIIILEILIVTVLLFASTSRAQSPFQAGINFGLGFPQEEFKENVDNIGLGLSGKSESARI